MNKLVFVLFFSILMFFGVFFITVCVYIVLFQFYACVCHTLLKVLLVVTLF